MAKRWSGSLLDNKGRVFHSVWNDGPPDAGDIEAITAIIDSLSAREDQGERRKPDGEGAAIAQRIEEESDAGDTYFGFDGSD